MSSALPPWQKYICEVCGLIYDEARGDPDGGLPPGTRFEDIPDDWACPICGVGKADFKPYTPGGSGGALRPSTQAAVAPRPAARGEAGVLIVGGGRAGWQVAQALRERDATLPITLLCACSGDVYDKPQLSVAVARGLAVEGLVRESAVAAAQRLNLRLLNHTHALGIDVNRRRLRSTRGSLPWRHLVLAQGAAPALPAVLPPALVWRVNDLAAYTRLRQALASGPQRLGLVGAGLVGCELANDLALAGHHITLLDTQPRPLAAQLPAAASARLLAAWQGLPIEFRGGVQVQGVQRIEDGAAPLQLQLAGGECLRFDHLIAATGLRTPDRLARSAGLAFDEAAGGIVVDAQSGATSQPGIHALGDCVVVNGRASRYIEPIVHQARAIAASIVGAALPAMPANAPLLRVKTSALPFTLRGSAEAATPWDTECDDAHSLRMQQRAADGTVRAQLVAQAG